MSECVARDLRRSLLAVDRRLLLTVRTLPHTRNGDRAAAAMSAIANHARGWVVIGVLGAASDHRHRAQWIWAASTVVLTEQTCHRVKRHVRRARPQLEDLPPLADVTSRYSMPSSHAATSVAAIYAFENLLPAWPLCLWALLTGASRSYLGVHYPSDVLVGAALGAAVGVTARGVESAWFDRDEVRSTAISRQRSP
jgi:membrane-associated phospholipid phosphatase